MRKTLIILLQILNHQFFWKDKEVVKTQMKNWSLESAQKINV